MFRVWHNTTQFYVINGQTEGCYHLYGENVFLPYYTLNDKAKIQMLSLYVVFSEGLECWTQSLKWNVVLIHNKHKAKSYDPKSLKFSIKSIKSWDVKNKMYRLTRVTMWPNLGKWYVHTYINRSNADGEGGWGEGHERKILWKTICSMMYSEVVIPFAIKSPLPTGICLPWNPWNQIRALISALPQKVCCNCYGS